MAKADQEDVAPKRGWTSWIALGAVALLATAGGAIVPQFLIGGGSAKDGTSGQERKHGKSTKPAFIPFGDVVVNLNDGRLNRFLRVKMILVVDQAEEKSVTELIGQKKAILKNWLITYLRDRSLEEVKGAAGANRLRREIQDQFNTQLFADGADTIQDVLFEEFVIQ
jgi:flagellar FliL protein